MTPEIALSEPVAEKKNIFKRKPKMEMPEDIVILSSLDELKFRLDGLYQSFDYLTDPVLIDSCIYEIKSVQMKYKFYLTLCRDRGLIARRGE